MFLGNPFALPKAVAIKNVIYSPANFDWVGFPCDNLHIFSSVRKRQQGLSFSDAYEIMLPNLRMTNKLTFRVCDIGDNCKWSFLSRCLMRFMLDC
jgi:hypothetical protein